MMKVLRKCTKDKIQKIKEKKQKKHQKKKSLEGYVKKEEFDKLNESFIQL